MPKYVQIKTYERNERNFQHSNTSSHNGLLKEEGIRVPAGNQMPIASNTEQNDALEVLTVEKINQAVLNATSCSEINVTNALTDKIPPGEGTRDDIHLKSQKTFLIPKVVKELLDHSVHEGPLAGKVVVQPENLLDITDMSSESIQCHLKGPCSSKSSKIPHKDAKIKKRNEMQKEKDIDCLTDNYSTNPAHRKNTLDIRNTVTLDNYSDKNLEYERKLIVNRPENKVSGNKSLPVCLHSPTGEQSYKTMGVADKYKNNQLAIRDKDVFESVVSQPHGIEKETDECLRKREKRLELAKLKMLQYSKKMLVGKHKLILQKWASEIKSRRIGHKNAKSSQGVKKDSRIHLIKSPTSAKSYLVKSPKSVIMSPNADKKVFKDLNKTNHETVKIEYDNKKVKLTRMESGSKDNVRTEKGPEERKEFENSRTLKTILNGEKFPDKMSPEHDLQSSIAKMCKKNHVEKENVSAEVEYKSVTEPIVSGLKQNTSEIKNIKLNHRTSLLGSDTEILKQPKYQNQNLPATLLKNKYSGKEKLKIKLNAAKPLSISTSSGNNSQTSNKLSNKFLFQKAFATAAAQSKSVIEPKSVTNDNSLKLYPGNNHAKGYSNTCETKVSGKTSGMSIDTSVWVPICSDDELKEKTLPKTMNKNLLTVSNTNGAPTSFVSTLSTTTNDVPVFISLPINRVLHQDAGKTPCTLQGSSLSSSTNVLSSSQTVSEVGSNLVTKTLPVFYPAVYPLIPVVTMPITGIPVAHHTQGLVCSGVTNPAETSLSTLKHSVKTSDFVVSSAIKNKTFTPISCAPVHLFGESNWENNICGQLFKAVDGSNNHSIFKVFSSQDSLSLVPERTQICQTVTRHTNADGNTMKQGQHNIDARTCISATNGRHSLAEYYQNDHLGRKLEFVSPKTTLSSKSCESSHIVSENKFVPVSHFTIVEKKTSKENQTSHSHLPSTSAKTMNVKTIANSEKGNETLHNVSHVNPPEKDTEIQDSQIPPKDKKYRFHSGKPKDKGALKTKTQPLKHTSWSRTEQSPSKIDNFSQNTQELFETITDGTAIHNDMKIDEGQIDRMQIEKLNKKVPVDDESNMELYEQFKIKPLATGFDMSRYLVCESETKGKADSVPQIENYFSLSVPSMENQSIVANEKDVTKNVTDCYLQKKGVVNVTVESDTLKDPFNLVQVPLPSANHIETTNTQRLSEQDLINYLCSTNNEKSKLILLNGNVCNRWEKLKKTIGTKTMSDPEFLHHLLSSAERNFLKTSETREMGSQTDEIHTITVKEPVKDVTISEQLPITKSTSKNLMPKSPEIIIIDPDDSDTDASEEAADESPYSETDAQRKAPKDKFSSIARMNKNNNEGLVSIGSETDDDNGQEIEAHVADAEMDMRTKIQSDESKNAVDQNNNSVEVEVDWNNNTVAIQRDPDISMKAGMKRSASQQLQDSAGYDIASKRAREGEECQHEAATKGIGKGDYHGSLSTTELEKSEGTSLTKSPETKLETLQVPKPDIKQEAMSAPLTTDSSKPASLLPRFYFHFDFNPAQRRDMNWNLKRFRDWLKRYNIQEDFEHRSAESLNEQLCRFYIDTAKISSKYYICRLLLHAFKDYMCQYVKWLSDDRIDITVNQEFKKSNEVYSIVCSTDSGFVPFHKNTVVFTKEDVEKLMNSRVLLDRTPQNLLWKVFFDINYYLGEDGFSAKFLQTLTKDSLVFSADKNGHYCTLGDEWWPPFWLRKPKMYEKSNMQQNCPVRTLKFYLKKLSGHTALFQTPKSDCRFEILYRPVPLGVKKLSNLMKEISEAAGLSTVYTLQSIGLLRKKQRFLMALKLNE